MRAVHAQLKPDDPSSRKLRVEVRSGGLRFVQALAQLRKVLVGDGRGHDVLDAGVDLVGDQGDDAFFAQGLETTVGRGGGHVVVNGHGLQHRDLLLGMPDGGKQM